ncbi:unnamed protein product [Urochloa humidicola]
MEAKPKMRVRTADDEVEINGPVMDEWDPWNPPYPPCRPAPRDLDLASHVQLINEWYDEINEIIATSRKNQHNHSRPYSSGSG